MNPLPMEREGTDCNSTPPIMTLPNELIFDVASHLESFKDLNSLLRTTRRFHTLLNTHLYRLAVAADETVREDIVWWVLSKYQVSSLRLLLDEGLPVQLKLLNKFLLYRYGIEAPVDLLRWICDLSDQKRSVPLARLLIERGADIEANSGCGTILHEAVCTDNVSLTELLLDHGADTSRWHSSTREQLLRRVERWQKRGILDR
jgi:hypothetical protein